MINKPPPLKGLHIRIPITIPIKGKGFIDHGSGLPFWSTSGPEPPIALSPLLHENAWSKVYAVLRVWQLGNETLSEIVLMTIIMNKTDKRTKPRRDSYDCKEFGELIKKNNTDTHTCTTSANVSSGAARAQ